jgi:tetratricopeptide (TPR) repeat protein
MTIEELIRKAYIEVGNFKQAISYFNEAEKINPKDSTIFYGRGKAYLIGARLNFEKASGLKDTYASDILRFIDAIKFKKRE